MSHPHTPHPERQTCMQVSEKFALHETTTRTKTPTPTKGRQAFTQATISMLATTIHKSNTTPHHQSGATTRTPNPQNKLQEAKSRHLPPTQQARGLVVSKPNSVSGQFLEAAFPTPLLTVCCAPNPAHYRQRVPHGIRCDPLPHPFSWCSLERR